MRPVMVSAPRWWIRRDMALLDDAIEASGGLARWNSLSRFTLHLSVRGSPVFRRRTCPRIQGPDCGGIDADAIGPLYRHHAAASSPARLQPDAITIENLDGQVLRTWLQPEPRIPDQWQRIRSRTNCIWSSSAASDLELFDHAVPPRPPRRRGGRAAALAGKQPRPGGAFARNSRRT